MSNASWIVSLQRDCWGTEALIRELGLSEMINGELRHVSQDHFEHAGAIEDLLPQGQLLRSYATGSQAVLVLADPEWIATISGRDNQWVNVTVIAVDPALAARTLNEVRERRNAPEDPADILPIDFSYECSGSPRLVRRRLLVPAWPEIRTNYTATVTEALDSLMEMRRPGENDGRLLLWHGPPGTGKTTAIRALMRSWRDWCRPLFIVDPDRLFEQASYLLGTIVDDADHDDEQLWRMLVIEDADELLRSDAKSRSGQALSRLLNLSDGLIGQGLQILVMLTTNEPLDELHPAVIRPGRCISQIRFGPLDRPEATRWLGSPPPQQAAAFSLAELFRLRRLGRVPSDNEAVLSP